MGKRKKAFDMIRFAQKGLDEAEEAKKAAYKEKGYEEFLTLGVGETLLSVDPTVEPREKEGKFGKQWIFRVEHKGQKYDLSVAVKSPLFRSMMSMLVEGNNTMTIVKAGEGRSTRYQIKELA